MYWNILVWLRIEIPDGFLHQIPENLKIDDLVTGGTINLQLTLYDFMLLFLFLGSTGVLHLGSILSSSERTLGTLTVK